MIKKALIKSILLLTLLGLILSVLNPIFILKEGHRNKLYQGLYEHQGDSLDVVFLGSSHMINSFNPNILWDKYGFTSFNYGTGGEPIDVTYYLLKEVLKFHDNPIVVIDLYYLGLTDEYGNEEYVRYVLDNMKMSVNKIDAIFHTTPSHNRLSFLLPILKYHGRWKELSEQDFKFDVFSTYYAKGYSAGENIYGKNNTFSNHTKETAEIPPKAKLYLDKIIELSKEEGFELTLAPHDYNSTLEIPSWHPEPAKMFNQVAEIAEDNNIPFINYNNLFDDLDFDFKTDMYNAGHMNIWGSNKINAHFGEFLHNNYHLPDHRKK